MPDNPWSEELAVAVRAARAAQTIHVSGRSRELEIHTKSSHVDLVTQIDVESEDAVREVILDAFPGDAILGEEGGQRGTAERRWIVDPLDGTLNYAHGFPYYCVSIALEVRGELVVGVVLDTAHDELFTARAGGGAWHGDKPLSVTACQRLDQALVATGFAYESRWMDENLALFGKMLHKTRAIRRPGAAALDLAHVAAGRFDGFREMYLKPWDVAAGLVLIREAGGQVSGSGGAPFTPGDRTLIASNGGVHQQLVSGLEEPS